MKSVRSLATLLTISLTALTALATPALAGICNEGLLARSEHWKNEAIRAHQKGNGDGERYALIKLALASGVFAGKSNQYIRKRVRQRAEDLELLSFQEEMARSGAFARATAKAITFLGMTNAVQSEVFGVRPYSNTEHRTRSLRALLSDLAYTTLTPAIFSLLENSKIKRDHYDDWQMDGLIADVAFESGVTAEFAKLDHQSPTDSDRALRARLGDRSLKSPAADTRETWYRGRIYLPWLATLAFFMAENATPREFTASVLRNTLAPYEYRHYKDDEYLADMSRMDVSFPKTKTLIAYDENLWAAINHRPNAPLAIDVLRELKTDTTVLRKISTVDDLAAINLAEFDNVIIFTHGLPDEVSIGLEPTKEIPRMREGANLIFLSCLVGRRGGEVPNDEAWIRFSKSILNGGKAIAATESIWVNLDPEKAGPETSPRNKRGELAGKVVHLTADVTGLALFAQTVLEAIFATHDEYYFSPKGIRIYDSKTDQVEYIPSQPTQPRAKP